MHKVGIIVLNYNGARDTLECVESLSVIQFPKVIYVVDNASTNADYELVKKKLEGKVILIRTEKNLGYAGGNNLGIKRALADGCDYICVLNNDTESTMDFLTPCVKKLKEDPQTGFVGPAIIDYTTGKVQSSGAMVSLFTGESKLLNFGLSKKLLKKEIDCDYVGGACIICSRKTIEKIGYIPECYFLFYEETEWCIKAKKENMKVLCLGDTTVQHKGSVSINKINGLNEYLMNRNRVAFIRRNCNHKIFAYAGYGWLIATELGRRILKKRTDINHIKYYRDGWKNKVDNKRFPFIIINER